MLQPEVVNGTECWLHPLSRHFTPPPPRDKYDTFIANGAETNEVVFDARYTFTRAADTIQTGTIMEANFAICILPQWRRRRPCALRRRSCRT